MMVRHCAYTACGLLGVLMVATLVTANVAGLRVNSTPSMPRGLWWVTSRDAPVRRGEIVTICPPDTELIRQGAERGYIPTGPCFGGFEPLVKPIAATGGDTVAVRPDGIVVNGEPVKGTAQLSRDSAGRPLRALPAGLYRVAPGDVWLLSGHDPRSFDSRYFGPVPAVNVQGVAYPVWVVR